MYLTFDIGGTHLRAGRYSSETKNLIEERKILSPNYLSNGSIEELYKSCKLLAHDLFPNDPPKGIIIGFPSPISSSGNFVTAPTLFGKEELALEAIKNYFNYKIWNEVPTFIINDVTAAGYRYVKDKEDFCIFTISSGIGNKVFIQGKPLIGINGRGGEIGHLKIDINNHYIKKERIICDCGQINHLGSVASGRGILNLAKAKARFNIKKFTNSFLFHSLNEKEKKSLLIEEKIETFQTRSIVKAFHEKDEWTLSLIKDSVKYIGNVIASIHLSTGVEYFIVIGGFAKSLGDNYIQMIKQSVIEYSWNIGQNWNSMIQMGILDDYDGLIGAGIYAETIMEKYMEKYIYKY